jgi:hypothetical protein
MQAIQVIGSTGHLKIHRNYAAATGSNCSAVYTVQPEMCIV